MHRLQFARSSCLQHAKEIPDTPGCLVPRESLNILPSTSRGVIVPVGFQKYGQQLAARSHIDPRYVSVFRGLLGNHLVGHLGFQEADE